jgi:hypothetical protein
VPSEILQRRLEHPEQRDRRHFDVAALARVAHAANVARLRQVADPLSIRLWPVRVELGTLPQDGGLGVGKRRQEGTRHLRRPRR